MTATYTDASSNNTTSMHLNRLFVDNEDFHEVQMITDPAIIMTNAILYKIYSGIIFDICLYFFLSRCINMSSSSMISSSFG